MTSSRVRVPRTASDHIYSRRVAFLLSDSCSALAERSAYETSDAPEVVEKDAVSEIHRSSCSSLSGYQLYDPCSKHAADILYNTLFAVSSVCAN